MITDDENMMVESLCKGTHPGRRVITNDGNMKEGFSYKLLLTAYSMQ